MMNHKRRTPIMLGIAALTLAACGSGSTSAKVSTGPTGSQPSAKTAQQQSPLPTVEVLDTANGQTVQFASLLPAVKPVLFWFWAPN